MSEFSSQQPQKLAPHSQESEEATLGAVLINPDVMADLQGVVQTDDFYFLHHRFIWECMVAIYERHEDIDALTVVDELRHRRDRDGQTYLDKIGGSAFITYLINNTPTHVHVETYSNISYRLAERRRLLDYASYTAKLALDDTLELEEIKKLVKAGLEALSTRDIRIGLKPLSDLMPEYLKELAALHSGEAANEVVPTGFRDLDHVFGGGFLKTELVVVAARPAMGKTAEMGSMAVNMARAGKKVAIFELEMKGSQLIGRIISSASGVNTTKFRTADFDETQWDVIIDAMTYAEKLPIWMDDTAARTVTQIETACAVMKRTFGLDAVFIDYLQIMGDGDIKADNRTGTVDKLIQYLKDMAKRLNVVVIVASQLSRSVESRADKRPQLSDLRESGNIEAAADIVIFLYRDDYYNSDSEYPNQIENIIGKSRSTLTGVVSLYFEKHTTTVRDIARRDHVDLNTLTVTTTLASGERYDWSADPVLNRNEEE